MLRNKLETSRQEETSVALGYRLVRLLRFFRD